MSGAKRNAQFEALFLDLLHACQGGGGEVGGGHVVVTYFLVTRRHFAHDGTAGHLEIHTLEKTKVKKTSCDMIWYDMT